MTSLPPTARMIRRACDVLGLTARGSHGRMSTAQAARIAADMSARVADRMPKATYGRMSAMPAQMAAKMPTSMAPAMDMKRVAGGLGLLAVGMGVVRWAASRPQTTRVTRDHAPKNRWVMVTVNCSPQRLASRSDLPDPIIRLGDAVDIKVAPAPGDRGTELGARLRDLPKTKISGMVTRRAEDDPRRIVEQALRDAKAIIESGEVLRPDWPASAQPPQVGKLLEFAGRRGGRS